MKAVVARLARKIKDALALRQRAGGEGAARLAADHPEEPAVRRHPDGGALPPPAPREAQAGHALRRVGLGAQRLALHAPARVEPAGLLLPRALLRVRVGDRRGHPGLQHLPGGHARSTGRSSARSVDYHCRSDFGYAFSRFVRTELESLDRKTTVLDPGRRAQQLQRPQAWAIRQIRERVKGIIWLNPRGPVGLGHRRQRDAALLAVLRHRQGVPHGGRSSSRSSISWFTHWWRRGR